MLRLGILGGGQLGRMTALAAWEYGIFPSIFDPDPDCCAGQVCPLRVGFFADHHALQQWAMALDAVTLEFENIPAECLDYLARHVPVRPGADLLRLSQDRLVEKTALQRMGLRVAPFQQVDNAADLASSVTKLRGDLFLKTRRLGYDGKGQVRIKTGASPQTSMQALEAAFATLNTPCIVEQAVEFVREVSIIIARNPRGQTTCLPLAENHHEDLAGGGKILRTTLVPAPNTSEALVREARDIAETIADQTGLCGVLAIEMFETPAGALCVNELAPRPHNSGHWSMNGATTSQFHLLVRAALDLPLPDTISYHPTRMRNLLGDEIASLTALLDEQGSGLHLYGKQQAKPGRKMGHLNTLLSSE